jgi:hypothetical protein
MGQGQLNVSDEQVFVFIAVKSRTLHLINWTIFFCYSFNHLCCELLCANER